MSITERILTTSGELFTRYGISPVRTEDISSQIGISKRTLYQHFDSKERLVAGVIERQLAEATKYTRGLRDNFEHPLVQASDIWDWMCSYQKTINPTFLKDVKIHYPDAWAMIQTFIDEEVTTMLVGNLEMGIKKGLYLEKINKEIMSCLWLHLCQGQHPCIGSHSQVKHHYIRGLLTEQGLRNYNLT
jgi:AcrR family transcriptional regulator